MKKTKHWPELPSPSNLEGPPILQEDVNDAIRKSCIGNALGQDMISTEMIKVIGQFGIENITERYNTIYETGHIPQDLLTSMYITLPKSQWLPNAQTIEPPA